MAMFQPGEAIVFLIMALGYVPVVWVYMESKSTKWFFWGYTALLLGILSTNLQTFILPREIMLFEHVIGVMGAGICFLIWSRRNYLEQFFLHRKLESFSKGGGKNK